MTTWKRSIGCVIAALALSFAMPAAAGDDHNKEKHEADLSGYQETPTTLSSPGTASFRLRVADDEKSFDWVLTYSGLTNVLQAHIHFAARAITGPIVVFLCTNLGNAPPGTTSGTQACPTSEGTVSGTATAADVGPGGAAAGIPAGDFAKVLDAIRAGAAYANIHTSARQSGEIRGQIHSHEHSE